ncbi:efflux RND transporter periplasmic adaptor subunit [Afifella marina DSM 2698]|uniref:Membrane fusion protein, multidrug efflux system n=1 Tax=Afifella marina DSM 2698 TaxID=1120955 RepID=A0A1G5P765_AFIMA|nr:efflux RND transporter periplasmic adaptor subunit [Afifella marina]MBK1625159.1 efflux RND transporter periplasmic adaptor subunit [Afifella marina DSM 2698]MBK1627063.1 efflux RND transporter periplasmic adaptor subunit [Afifella marina]MBK5919400.1 hypothetical protein [Afifella marina]RAI19620.1 hypothetical protein CH311_12530 [Afifella marina DSM 2698]SCZ44840.1 membrane fusion protein, multidrug efflux system [Afifella marina DSM 2698]
MSLVKQVIFIALIGAAALAGYAAFDTWFNVGRSGEEARAARGPEAIAVEVARAKAETIERSFDAVGSTRARRSVEIVPLASGRITELFFEAGQKVEAGAPLLTLDDDIEAADVKEAEAKLREAELALERARSLHQSNTVTAATVETLTAARVTGEAELERARRRFADRTVRAPFSGIAGLRRIDLGARADDQTVITTLDDLSSVEVEFALPETAFGEIKSGMPIFARSAAFPDKIFSGEIIAIDSRIDPASRAFKVRASIPNEDFVLPAGMFMTLSVVLDRRIGVMVPEEAVMVEGDGAYLFVADGETARRRSVDLGQRQKGAVEISKGLKDGEAVIVRGVQRLRDRSQIRIVEDADDGKAAANADGIG